MRNYRLSHHEVALWLKYIEHQVGFVLPNSQTQWIKGVIERHLQHCQKSSTDFLHAIVNDAELYHQLIDDILIPRTQFFRHLPTFEWIEIYAAAWQYQHNMTCDSQPSSQAVGSKDKTPLTAWSVGCSSGQEAVSIALALNQAMTTDQNFVVYGSDFHQKALTEAQLGHYQLVEKNFIPTNYHSQLDEIENSKFALKADLKTRLQYFSKNLIDDQQPVPFGLGKCQLIVCQNVLIYFRQFEQRDIVQFLSQYLAEDGVLLLSAGQILQMNEEWLMPLQLPMLNGYCKPTAPLWLKELGNML